MKRRSKAMLLSRQSNFRNSDMSNTFMGMTHGTAATRNGMSTNYKTSPSEFSFLT